MYQIIILIDTFLIFLLVPYALGESLDDPLAIHHEFPTSILPCKPRLDSYTNEPIVRGRLEHLGGFRSGFSKNNTKISLKDFQRILQCAPNEPGIEGNRSPLSFLQLIKPKRETIELMVVQQQTQCSTWLECQKLLLAWRTDPKQYERKRGCSNRLLRIINGELYYDSPFYRCFEHRMNDDQYYAHFLVLDKVSDIPDSVFFQGEEESASFYKFPFAILSNGPSFKSMDFPYIWPRELRAEKILYEKNYLRDEKDYKVRHPLQIEYTHGVHHSLTIEHWMKRIPKAAYFASLAENRQLAFDIANVRPDLIDAKWSGGYFGKASDPFCTDNIDINNILDYSIYNNESSIGSIKSILKYHTNGEEYLSKKYKYIISIAGYENNALSGRTSHILAHSGAVLLLQTTDLEYHYSARLKPWVHYVPISYNTADLIKKIEWLQQHDDLAYQIAKNAKAFGDSYLRLEDYFCYIASLQVALGSIYQNNISHDALRPFDAVKLTVPSHW